MLRKLPPHLRPQKNHQGPPEINPPIFFLSRDQPPFVVNQRMLLPLVVNTQHRLGRMILNHPSSNHHILYHNNGPPRARCHSTTNTWLGGTVATSPTMTTTISDLFSLAPTTIMTATQTVGIMVVYAVAANVLYLARRAHLRKMTMRRLWEIRTTRDPGVPLVLFGGMLLAWQCLVLVFPIVEPLAKIATKGCIFFYSYPKAQGGGYIWEPLDCQTLGANQRAKRQIRLDWHRFVYNLGPVGRDGFRHPPSIERNFPHIDIPRYQIRHWPWRRRIGGGRILPPRQELDQEEG